MASSNAVSLPSCRICLKDGYPEYGLSKENTMACSHAFDSNSRKEWNVTQTYPVTCRACRRKFEKRDDRIRTTGFYYGNTFYIPPTYFSTDYFLTQFLRMTEEPVNRSNEDRYDGEKYETAYRSTYLDWDYDVQLKRSYPLRFYERMLLRRDSAEEEIYNPETVYALKF